MSEEIRQRILAAAARVYSQYGFRGATTRLIAAEAGVNEVTLFRTFGSKAELLQAMLQSHVSATAVPIIVDTGDPERAITEWCATVLDYLRGHAHLIRTTIAEAEERPDAACAACEGPNSAGASLVLYVERLREEGRTDADADVDVAVSMFMSALFGDALYRDVMPESFPQPVEEAAAKYARTFMRAVGLRAIPVPDRSRERKVAGSRRRTR
jgi:AcrR family transcriptional regulator